MLKWSRYWRGRADDNGEPCHQGERKDDGDPLFAPVVSALAKDRQVTVGKMMGALNVAIGQGERFDPGHGRVMKEWIAVAPGKAPRVDLAREAYRFVKEGKA